jgi:polyhydroxyalkanoate synthesis repressor PhaR
MPACRSCSRCCSIQVWIQSDPLFFDSLIAVACLTSVHSVLHRQMRVATVARRQRSTTKRASAHCLPLPCRAARQKPVELSMSEERLIKKYANRRLYDAAQSRHITIDDIRNMVIAGTRVKVIEDKSNEDITRLVLLQVIADQEQFGRPILSTTLLESMIRFYGNSMQSFFSSYLEKSVETFMRQQEVMQAQLNRGAASQPGGTGNPIADLARQNLELWSKMQETLLAAFVPPRDTPPTNNNTSQPAGKTDAPDDGDANKS